MQRTVHMQHMYVALRYCDTECVLNLVFIWFLQYHQPSDKIQTQCLSNAMEITIHKCVLQGSHDYTTAKMSDGDCAFKKNDDRVTVTMTNPLGECGMQLDYEDGQIIYSVILNIFKINY